MKDYGGAEFKLLDNLTNINGENVDVYIQVTPDIGGVSNPKCGHTNMKLNADGRCFSDEGPNTAHISLSHKFRSTMGATLAHEGGHVIHDVTRPEDVFKFWKEHPNAKNDGHDQGNPSGQYADQCEREYLQRRKIRQE